MKKKKYKWGHNRPFNDYSTYFKKIFNERIQKISIDAGFSCPNRDGTKGVGGCSYCNNDTFNPFYCTPSKSVTQQLNEGIAFFEPKYKTQKYLAYFQAFSNTYGSLDLLKKLYEEALTHEKVIGLVIGTRPDCVNNEILDYIAELSEKYFIVVEYGIESTLNRTLNLINRCHTFEDSVFAINETVKRNIETGVHMILGLPEETDEEMINHAKIISELPIKSLKLHQLQIIKNTVMAKQFKQNPESFNLFSADSYIELIIKFIENLSPDIILERFISESPADLLIAPKWNGLKNFEIVSRIEKRLLELDTFQGKFFNVK
ncbi:MAG: TIGR01212 family radical SAM protein [Bacteroidales bacterium]|nr:TIGR01212 family radical SAM protein [Bacteroidales bacterium]MBN2756039.1 TIGR01212 family radical SAM protein [Bacteroidales bacterium]